MRIFPENLATFEESNFFISSFGWRMRLSINSIDTLHSTMTKNIFVSGYSTTVMHGTWKKKISRHSATTENKIFSFLAAVLLHETWKNMIRFRFSPKNKFCFLQKWCMGLKKIQSDTTLIEFLFLSIALWCMGFAKKNPICTRSRMKK